LISADFDLSSNIFHRHQIIPVQADVALQHTTAFLSSSITIHPVKRIWAQPFLNPLNAELNPVFCLLALLGAHYFLHVSRIRVKSLTLRLLMSYIYICIYIYDISNLRVNTSAHCSGRKQVKG